MATKAKQASWVIERIPDEIHDLACRGNADEQAVYHNVYAAIWNQDGKHADVLPAMREATLAMMAVVGLQRCLNSECGPNRDGTSAIAMVALQMYRFLAAIRDKNAGATAIVRTYDDDELGYSPNVPAGYANVASAIVKAVWEEAESEGNRIFISSAPGH